MHRLQVTRGAPALTDDAGGDDAPDRELDHGRAAVAPGPSRQSSAGPFAVAALVTLVDQLTKIWAIEALSDGPVSLLGDVLQLRLAFNPGGAFSILTGFTPLLAGLAAVMALIIVRTTHRTADRITAYSLALVLGGAVGNLIDRLAREPGFMRGEVVDFIGLSFWPTFNLADSAITIGVLLIVFRGWRA